MNSSEDLLRLWEQATGLSPLHPGPPQHIPIPNVEVSSHPADESATMTTIVSNDNGIGNGKENETSQAKCEEEPDNNTDPSSSNLANSSEENDEQKKKSETSPSHCFAIDLWDQFEVISQNLENDLQTCKIFAVFISKKAAIEENYGKELKKLSQETLNRLSKIELASNTEWETMKHMIETCGQVGCAHKEFSSSLVATIAKPIESYYKEQHEVLKNIQQRGMKQTKELAEVYAAAEKSKLQWTKLQHELDSLQMDLAKTRMTGNAKPSAIVKATEKVTNLSQKTAWARAEFAQTVHSANELQTRHFEVDLKGTLESLELLWRERATFHTRILQQCAMMETEFPFSLAQNFWAPTLEQAKNVNVDMDIVSFICSLTSDQPHYTPLTGPPHEMLAF